MLSPKCLRKIRIINFINSHFLFISFPLGNINVFSLKKTCKGPVYGSKSVMWFLNLLLRF